MFLHNGFQVITVHLSTIKIDDSALAAEIYMHLQMSVEINFQEHF